MNLAMYTYPWVLDQEGVAKSLDAIHERAGCGTVILPVQYHSGRFWHVGAGRPRLHFADDVAHYYRPDSSRYQDTRIQPIVSERFRDRDVLRDVREETRRRGTRLSAWVVCLHSSAIGRRHPDLTQHTVYGDPVRSSLCPSHPEVRLFLRKLLTDIAVNYEPDSFELEAVEFAPFIHGDHHELTGIAPDPFHAALLGLDFNEYTCKDMAARGVDVEYIRDFVRRHLDGACATSLQETGSGWEYFAHSFLEEPEFYRLLEARMGIITDLVAELTEAVRAVSTAPIYTLLSVWRPLHMIWLEGHSPGRLLRVCDGIQVPTYYPDTAEISRDYVHLGRLLDGFDQVTGCITAFPPYTVSQSHLRSVIDTVTAHGVDKVNLYSYGFLREETLDWIRSTAAG